ncbi:hypothetical protein HGRIS_011263 [Hohenbuehelia grisea]|uniref:DUF2235 domain-containing protein n=1 Tax=Hohenbuehelia grisea TaxID=104357 RepID=A0ABR3JUL2_9AGAR
MVYKVHVPVYHSLTDNLPQHPPLSSPSISMPGNQSPGMTKRGSGLSSSSDEDTLFNGSINPSKVSTLRPDAFEMFDDESPDVIPPIHPFRTLVLCFDGTGDQSVNSIICAYQEADISFFAQI